MRYTAPETIAVKQELDPFFITQVREGKCVLFAGAGLSAAAGYPSWTDLLRGVMGAAKKAHPELKVAGLESLLAEGKLLEAAAYLRDAMDREPFYAALRALLKEKDVAPSPIHELLPHFRFRAIVTTNFDQLIERAFGGNLPVATQKDAKDLAKYLGTDTPFLFKVHGDIDRPDTIVLTAEEFAQATVDNKAFKNAFSALLLTSPLLFVGYSHSDPDFDLFLREHVLVFGKEGARRYALMKAGDEKDAILQELLLQKSVQVLPYTEHDELPAFFERLRDAVEARAEQLTMRPPPTALPNRTDTRGVSRRARRAPTTPKAHYVVVIPGLFASKLSVRQNQTGETPIWLNLFRLAMGGMSKLDLAAPQPLHVTPTDILAQFSLKLVSALARQHEVLPFPYDWRLDYRKNADRLSDFLKLEVRDGACCDLVAINEGGLVARSYLADYRGAWRQLQGKEGGGRLVMLGTANHGSFEALRTLLGRQSFVSMLGRIDLRHTAEDIRRILASFPSMYQTLPSPLVNATWNALYQRESYGRLEVSGELLEDGLRFHKEIADAVDPESMFCVLGDGKSTVVSIEDPRRLDQEQQWAVTLEGDGNVAHHYARLQKNGQAVPTYYAPVEHGALGNDAHVANAVVEILGRGTTALLPTQPSARTPLQ
jgi:hypothetical protein